MRMGRKMRFYFFRSRWNVIRWKLRCPAATDPCRLSILYPCTKTVHQVPWRAQPNSLVCFMWENTHSNWRQAYFICDRNIPRTSHHISIVNLLVKIENLPCFINRVNKRQRAVQPISFRPLPGISNALPTSRGHSLPNATKIYILMTNIGHIRDL